MKKKSTGKKNPKQNKKRQHKKIPLKLRLRNKVTGMINTLNSIYNLNVAYLLKKKNSKVFNEKVNSFDINS